MYVRLQIYCERFSLTTLRPFGFQNIKFTANAIVQFVELSYSALKSINYLVTILLHFSTAIDTANHSNWIEKINLVSVRDVYLD